MLNPNENVLIVGLGNVGDEYEHTRHNAGFDVIDDIASLTSVSFKKGFNGFYTKISSLGDKDVFLLKPATFMNLSGKSVKPFLDFYKIPTENMIVIQDDMDLDLGNVKAKILKGDGGHRGIRSIVAETGKSDFIRIKVGIGHPQFKSDVVNFVLTRPQGTDLEAYSQGLHDAALLTLLITKNGYDKGSNMFYSQRDKKKKELND